MRELGMLLEHDSVKANKVRSKTSPFSEIVLIWLLAHFM